MVGSTSYEVQVMQGGKWRIHAHFPPSARDDAIEEAKALESMPGVAGIKVVRDEYDDRTGLHKEHIIYRFTPTTPPPSQDASGGKYDRYMARAQANRMDDIDFGDQPSSSRQAKSSGLGVVTKLLLILLFSIAFAALVTGLMNGFLPYKKIAGIKFYGEMRSNIMIGAAIITFLSSTLFSYLVFMNGEELDKPNLQLREKMKRLEAAKRQRAAAKAKAEQDKERKRDQKKRTQEEDKLKQQAEEDLKRKAKEQAEQPSAAEDSEDQKGDDADAKQAAEQEEKQEEEQEFSDLSPVAEAQKAVLMGFFGEAIRALPAERKKMDNYNRFGVNLYLAGAAEALGGVRNLDSESISKILAHSLGVMGLKAEHAEAFANRYEDYLLQDVRYMEMFQAGRQTIASYLDGDKEAPKLLDQSLQEWNKPKAPEDPEKEVVVMFTDIVGSTAMTHEKGNLAAQEVVRAHNRVVRDALAKTGGQEIKHTGDGIMASFQKVTDSLLSTQQMQMMNELHNQQLPDIPLKVKIGINAGRVVVEEQDLYGVTVQMAARIVDKARPTRFTYPIPSMGWPKAATGVLSNAVHITSRALMARFTCKNWCGTTKWISKPSRPRPLPNTHSWNRPMPSPAARRCPAKSNQWPPISQIKLNRSRANLRRPRPQPLKLNPPRLHLHRPLPRRPLPHRPAFSLSSANRRNKSPFFMPL